MARCGATSPLQQLPPASHAGPHTQLAQYSAPRVLYCIASPCHRVPPVALPHSPALFRHLHQLGPGDVPVIVCIVVLEHGYGPQSQAKCSVSGTVQCSAASHGCWRVWVTCMGRSRHGWEGSEDAAVSLAARAVLCPIKGPGRVPNCPPLISSSCSGEGWNASAAFVGGGAGLTQLIITFSSASGSTR